MFPTVIGDWISLEMEGEVHSRRKGVSSDPETTLPGFRALGSNCEQLHGLVGKLSLVSK